MFIRTDYIGMFDEVMSVIASGNTKIVVSGNPGIGKSWFGIYFCHRLLRDNEGKITLVWESRREEIRILFRGGVALEGNLTDFKDVLRRDSDVWCVCP